MSDQLEYGPQNFSSGLAYPEIPCGRNPKLAAVLMEDYAGNASELTAVMQYLYGSWMVRENCPEVYEALKYISIIEMEHMDALAEAIMNLGGDPKYITCGGRKPEQYWNAKAVDYSKARCNILLSSIGAERAAINRYQQQIQTVGDEAVAALLQRIVMDEQIHLRAFMELYQKYEGGHAE